MLAVTRSFCFGDHCFSLLVWFSVFSFCGLCLVGLHQLLLAEILRGDLATHQYKVDCCGVLEGTLQHQEAFFHEPTTPHNDLFQARSLHPQAHLALIVLVRKSKKEVKSSWQREQIKHLFFSLSTLLPSSSLATPRTKSTPGSSSHNVPPAKPKIENKRKTNSPLQKATKQKKKQKTKETKSTGLHHFEPSKRGKSVLLR